MGLTSQIHVLEQTKQKKKRKKKEKYALKELTYVIAIILDSTV